MAGRGVPIVQRHRVIPPPPGEPTAFLWQSPLIVATALYPNPQSLGMVVAPYSSDDAGVAPPPQPMTRGRGATKVPGRRTTRSRGAPTQTATRRTNASGSGSKAKSPKSSGAGSQQQQQQQHHQQHRNIRRTLVVANGATTIRPQKHWVCVDRAPGGTAGFTVKTWIPETQLTESERIQYIVPNSARSRHSSATAAAPFPTVNHPPPRSSTPAHNYDQHDFTAAAKADSATAGFDPTPEFAVASDGISPFYPESVTADDLAKWGVAAAAADSVRDTASFSSSWHQHLLQNTQEAASISAEPSTIPRSNSVTLAEAVVFEEELTSSTRGGDGAGIERVPLLRADLHPAPEDERPTKRCKLAEESGGSMAAGAAVPLPDAAAIRSRDPSSFWSSRQQQDDSVACPTTLGVDPRTTNGVEDPVSQPPTTTDDEMESSSSSSASASSPSGREDSEPVASVQNVRRWQELATVATATSGEQVVPNHAPLASAHFAADAAAGEDDPAAAAAADSMDDDASDDDVSDDAADDAADDASDDVADDAADDTAANVAANAPEAATDDTAEAATEAATEAASNDASNDASDDASDDGANVAAFAAAAATDAATDASDDAADDPADDPADDLADDPVGDPAGDPADDPAYDSDAAPFEAETFTTTVPVATDVSNTSVTKATFDDSQAVKTFEESLDARFETSYNDPSLHLDEEAVAALSEGEVAEVPRSNVPSSSVSFAASDAEASTATTTKISNVTSATIETTAVDDSSPSILEGAAVEATNGTKESVTKSPHLEDMAVSALFALAEDDTLLDETSPDEISGDL